MHRCSHRRLIGCFAMVALAFFAFAGVAQAACYSTNARLSAATINNFTSDPTGWLAKYPSGGAVMISAVRDLVASDPTALSAILSLVNGANADQLNALGTGLGQAALICLGTDQSFATEIQQAVAATTNSTFDLAFAAVFGDKPIGGLGGGAGGGGGGGGGPTSPLFGSLPFFNGTPEIFTGTSTRNTGTNFFTSNITGTTPGTPGGTTTSVSPSR